jgi:hypothetical protein
MPVITKSGRDLHASPLPAPLPTLDASISPQVLAIIDLLIQHQEALASPTVRTVVIQLCGADRVSLKCTHDLA